MRLNTVLFSFLVLGMVSVTLACDAQSGETAAGPGQQSNAVTSSAATDSAGGWIGKAAPGFSLTDTNGKTVDVGKIIGTRPVILVFYRGVW